MGADYSFYMKTIETHARTFLTLYDLAIDRVWENLHTIEISTIAYHAINLVKEWPLSSTWIAGSTSIEPPLPHPLPVETKVLRELFENSCAADHSTTFRIAFSLANVLARCVRWLIIEMLARWQDGCDTIKTFLWLSFQDVRGSTLESFDITINFNSGPHNYGICPFT